jgi:hypothetical protein
MKTALIVICVVLLIVVLVFIYIKSGNKDTVQQPPIQTTPTGSNFFDFASTALPSILSEFGNKKPATGLGSTSPNMG